MRIKMECHYNAKERKISMNAPRRKVFYGEDISQNPIPACPPDAMARLQTASGQSIGLTDRLLSTHLLQVGSTGCGKTTVVYSLLDQLIASLRTIDILVIFDPDGGYAARYFNPSDPRHIIVGTGKKYCDYMSGWNIFREMCSANWGFDRNYKMLAREMAKAIMFAHRNQTQPFFSDAPTDLIADVLIDHIQTALRNRTVADLTTEHFVQWIKRASFEDWVELTGKEDFRAHQMYIGRDASKLTNQSLGVFGEMNAAMEDTFSAFEAPRRGSFSMRDLICGRGGKILFMEYDLSLGEIQQPLFRLWFDLAIKFGLSQTGAGNIWLICDEQSLLPHLNNLSTALNFGRAHGIKIISALQSVNQFRDAYGDQADSILAGFCSLIAYRCYDAATREYLSERFGKNFMALHYRNANDAPDDTTREGHVVEDWDVRSLKTGEAFVDLAYDDGHPFRCQFADQKNG